MSHIPIVSVARRCLKISRATKNWQGMSLTLRSAKPSRSTTANYLHTPGDVWCGMECRNQYLFPYFSYSVNTSVNLYFVSRDIINLLPRISLDDTGLIVTQKHIRLREYLLSLLHLSSAIESPETGHRSIMCNNIQLLQNNAIWCIACVRYPRCCYTSLWDLVTAAVIFYASLYDST